MQPISFFIHVKKKKLNENTMATLYKPLPYKNMVRSLATVLHSEVTFYFPVQHRLSVHSCM